ncbi:C45 family peptidase [Microbacterium sp. KUDC0406]|uniref:C45 family autoproteolytic acyltransferase/hydolase n=1 Tax=Microbacterium sp. KUDC0406 TaxID=2909588 RepID=UPI001F440F18|nr:C45 family peptidase [Microbacterium sp. KUDC0406]UJP09118.1 C45 family peptidase [Microbacterium sp. KUDC0406]
MEITHLDPVSGLAWSVFRGGREEVMRALGSEHADAIHAFRDLRGGSWQAQVRRADGAAAERFDAVRESTSRLLPVESQELAWIAEGAGVPERELWARNLRGDLGRDGTGCSDLALTTDAGVLMGHNEDGDGELRDEIRLVTLDIEGDPTITAVWYPGMLPSNAFVTTADGLAFGMDHVPVVTADTSGAGRHFVARHAQRQHSGEAARAALSVGALRRRLRVRRRRRRRARGPDRECGGARRPRIGPVSAHEPSAPARRHRGRPRGAR